MEYGLRLGVEYIVVDLKFSSDRVTRLVRTSGRTKVIGQHRHREENSWGWDDESRMIQYRRATSLGCDMGTYSAIANPGIASSKSQIDNSIVSLKLGSRILAVARTNLADEINSTLCSSNIQAR